MEESRLIRNAKAGRPQAIASFLGNRLARFNIWVTATPSRQYLNLSLECLELPSAEVVLPLIQRLMSQLRPRNVELVKVTARFYGEIRPAWEETFLMSEIGQEPASVVLSSEFPQESNAVTVLDPAIQATEVLASSAQLAIAINKRLGSYGVAAKIVQRGTIARIELRGRQEPSREDCLLVIYDLLPQAELFEVDLVQVIGFAAEQLVSSWTEEILLDEIMPNRHHLSRRTFLSNKEKEEFLLPLGIGLFMGALIFFVPLLNAAFRGVGSLVFDAGHAIGYCLMGYLPTAINNPFSGGGIIATMERSPLLFWASYGVWGFLIYWHHRRLFVILAIVMVALWQGLIFQSTILTALFLGVSGQVTLWALAAILFYCALGGYSCRNQAERSLYMILGTFFMFYHVELYWAMWQDSANDLNWTALLGIAVTLTLPYLTYRIYAANQEGQKNPMAFNTKFHSV